MNRSSSRLLPLWCTLFGIIGLPTAGAAEPQIVPEITSLQVSEVNGGGQRLVVSAEGNAPTAGFSDVRLLRVHYATPPSDGVQDYFLVATPPDGPAATVVTPVSAVHEWPGFREEAPWIRGVRVHGVGSGVRMHELTPQQHVRRNILDLSSDELETLRQAIATMKARPANDPTSWQFQANIHGMPGASTNPLFEQCEHGTIQFLTWHRAFLYHFERILREASGDDSLTLPYWDWTTARALPPAFREPGSSLFDGTRSINNGALLPLEVVSGDLQSSLNQVTFWAFPSSGFSGRLEGTPHGAVHVLIGGNMGSVPTAGRDPIFWLHHCNIDRIWDRWLTLNAGRMNPGSSSFLQQEYSFADHDGSTVTVTVGDMLWSQELGYRYDDVPNPTPTPAPPFPIAVAEHAEEHKAEDLPLVASSAPPGQAAAAPMPQQLTLAPKKVELAFRESGQAAVRTAVRNLRPSSEQRLIIEIQGVEIDEAPRFTYGVYLNLPEEDLPEERRALYRVGVLNLFRDPEQRAGNQEADEAEESAHAAHDLARFDATQTIARLQAAGVWDEDSLSVTFVPITPIAAPDEAADLQAKLEESAKAANVRFQRVDVRAAADDPNDG